MPTRFNRKWTEMRINIIKVQNKELYIYFILQIWDIFHDLSTSDKLVAHYTGLTYLLNDAANVHFTTSIFRMPLN